MNRKKLRKLAKKINNGVEVNIKFIFAPPDHFAFLADENKLEVSSFYHALDRNVLIVYLAHEIGHMNTNDIESYYRSDYTCEYEANRWALYRLDELNLHEAILEYEKYLKELFYLEITDDEDEEYQAAATDLLFDLELI